jgi:hypothetical protein
MPEQRQKEKCSNPFFRCESQNPTDIALDIIYKGEQLPICEDCWTKLAETDIEWGQPLPEPNGASPKTLGKRLKLEKAAFGDILMSANTNDNSSTSRC